ncbi:cytoplasmic polyadenylated homeobox-like protein 2 [Loxodonta africana]|uniref:cytoplasmic polyadenylated homeobox-like protein 2 n=1 Tax=Loxodonta africana TaxID=9785 RepID=UPI000C813CB6|nr:pituitary homeobox 1-like [Loxodonta africana]
MASDGSPTAECDREEEIRTEQKRRKRKRHVFTKEELLILNNKFSENPYPDFTTRRELSNLVHCSMGVIETWFQNKRARLPAKERHRIFVVKKGKAFPVQGHSPLSLQDTKPEAPKDGPEQSFSYAQETQLGRAGCSSVETQGVPSQQLGLDGSGVPNIQKEPGYALENSGNTASGLYPGSEFPSYRSAPGLHSPAASVEHFDRDRTERGRSQYASPYLQQQVYSAPGGRQQQEERKDSPYSLLQGQQQNGRQCHLQQPQQPQHCQEKLWFQHPSHGDLGQQLPSLQAQEQSWYPQTNRESLSSQLQQAAPQTVAGSQPLPPGQDTQNGAAEQPRAQQQQLWDERSAGAIGWDSGSASRRWY